MRRTNSCSTGTIPMPIKYPIRQQQKPKKFAADHRTEKRSSFGLNLCKNWYWWAYLFAGASVTWNEEETDAPKLDEM